MNVNEYRQQINIANINLYNILNPVIWYLVQHKKAPHTTVEAIGIYDGI